MDHHCPWLNNCIGKRNYKVFIVFLVIGSVDYLFHSVICALDLLDLVHIEIHMFDHQQMILLASFFISFLLFLTVFPVLCIHLFSIVKNKKNIKIVPSRLDSSDTSSMLITPSISAADTSSSPFMESVRAEGYKGCFQRKVKQREFSLVSRDFL
jgi:hypothetical protein